MAKREYNVAIIPSSDFAPYPKGYTLMRIRDAGSDHRGAALSGLARYVAHFGQPVEYRVPNSFATLSAHTLIGNERRPLIQIDVRRRVLEKLSLWRNATVSRVKTTLADYQDGKWLDYGWLATPTLHQGELIPIQETLGKGAIEGVHYELLTPTLALCEWTPSDLERKRKHDEAQAQKLARGAAICAERGKHHQDAMRWGGKCQRCGEVITITRN